MKQVLLSMDAHYAHISLKHYVIMPNHVHPILSVAQMTGGTSRTPSPTNATIPAFVSTFKRFVHKEIGCKIWQRSYYDHIIRGEEDYCKIAEYIENNPKKWEIDRFYQK